MHQSPGRPAKYSILHTPWSEEALLLFDTFSLDSLILSFDRMILAEKDLDSLIQLLVNYSIILSRRVK
jgi:hypothetical protein